MNSIMICLFMFDCIRPAVVTPIAPIPKFLGGELVRSRLTEQRGQIVTYICFKNADRCIYQVRWADKPKYARWMQETELLPT